MKKLLVTLVVLSVSQLAFSAITANFYTQTIPPEVLASAFTTAIGFIGGYLLYGILAGPAAVAGIYIMTKDKKVRKYAWIGCIIGCLIGLTLKIIALS